MAWSRIRHGRVHWRVLRQADARKRAQRHDIGLEHQPADGDRPELGLLDLGLHVSPSSSTARVRRTGHRSTIAPLRQGSSRFWNRVGLE